MCHDMRNHNEQHAIVKPSQASYGAASSQVSRSKSIKERVGQDGNDTTPWIPHDFDPKKVQKVSCNNCSFIQPPAQTCKKCKITFGQYFCDICLLYDNDTAKEYWHCHQCRECKTGGKHNYFHCDKCQACFHNDFARQHLHLTEKLCSVCEEVMDIQFPSMFMKLRCGHQIHRHCFRTLVDDMRQCAECEEPTIEQQQSLQQSYSKKGQLKPQALQKVRIKCDDCKRN